MLYTTIGACFIKVFVSQQRPLEKNSNTIAKQKNSNKIYLSNNWLQDWSSLQKRNVKKTNHTVSQIKIEEYKPNKIYWVSEWVSEWMNEEWMNELIN